MASWAQSDIILIILILTFIQSTLMANIAKSLDITLKNLAGVYK